MMQVRLAGGWVVAAALVLTLSLGAEVIRSERFGAVFAPGEEIVFRLRGALRPGESGVIGEVLDSAGKSVKSRRIPAASFAEPGWSCRMPEGKFGLFTIRFKAVDEAGKERVLAESYRCRVGSTDREILRDFQTFAILPEPLPIGERSPVMGVSDQLDGRMVGRDLAPFIDRLGFSFVRIHSIGWGAFFTDLGMALEPERGKYNFEYLDRHIAELKKYRLGIVGNIMYTPRWASAFPEKEKINICVREYSSYAPKEMGDWTDFIGVLIDRYGNDIKTWEIWNEVSFPGWSCFWMDTPENYLKLHKAAATAIRAKQPDAEIWLSAVDRHFWNYLVKTDIHDFFDKFNLHGAEPDVRYFHDIDRKAGWISRPWVCSESHALLVRGGRNSDGVTEEGAAQKMMVNILFTLKRGAEKIALFDMLNLAELEMLEDFHRAGVLTQASGFFRRQPVMEPRLAAVAIANFNRLLGVGGGYRAEYRFAGARNGVLLDGGPARDLLVVWSDSGAPSSPVDPALAAQLKGADIFDWEGNRLAGPQFEVEPGRMYFIAVSKNFHGSLPATDDVLTGVYDHRSNDVKFAVPGAVSGAVHRADWNRVAVPDMLDRNTEIPSFRVDFDAAGLTVEVEVRDVAHSYTSGDAATAWQYDSLQFAFDTAGEGNLPDMLEFLLARTPAGPVLVKTLVPVIGGALPTGWTGRLLPVANATVSIDELPDSRVRYRARISWSEFFPLLPPKPGDPLRMAFLVNNNDGNGRAGYWEWGSGIGGDKNPAAFGRVAMVGPEARLKLPAFYPYLDAACKEARNRIEPVDGGGFKVMMSSPAKRFEGAMQLICDVRLVPGATYRLNFTAEAAGAATVDAIYLLAAPPWTRFAEQRLTLEPGINHCSVVLNVAPGEASGSGSLRLFLGQLPGGETLFRDFTLTLEK